MILDRKWEKFRGGPTPAHYGQVRVTIARDGHLYLNSVAHKAFGSQSAVNLYYNRDDDAIALEPASPEGPESFRLVKHQMGWIIHASPFCHHNRIRIDQTERFIKPVITDNGLMILSLREMVSVARIDRGPRTRVQKRAAPGAQGT